MSDTTETRLQVEYHDLLDSDPDPALRSLVADLDFGYSGGVSSSAGVPPSRRDILAAKPGRPTARWTSRVRWSRALVAPVLLVLLFAGLGIAWALGITSLGKATNDVSYIGSLGLFRHTGDSLHQGSKPELLFLGAQLNTKVEPERWAVIKALDQFGSFGGVTAWPDTVRIPCGNTLCFPSFDLDHMIYRSRYVDFVNKDLVNARFKLVPRMSNSERKLFYKYSNPLGPRASLKSAISAALSRPGSRSLPLLVVAGYVQTWPTLPVTADDFKRTTGTTLPNPCPPQSCTGPYYISQNAPFRDVQQSLQTGHAVNGLPQSLVTDVNAEANIITALVCHADDMRPSSVCGRAVIRKILRAVK